ncbi:Drebrin-like protein A [Collichthys lucidus]|uniref:Drebrin n=1 Tax=Collichthys lucidus TaxID=240159 RepID=A0A4U5UVK5_COLLU|nr:Drebrin-like protein A [Collichthys lucidus]
MSTRTVNLDTYSLSLLTAKEDILNPRSSTNWAIFAYDGLTNKLKLADSGAGGMAELAGKFHISKPQYGLCKVGSIETGGPRIAMISWVGQNVEEYRRTECASHIPAIKNFFKEAHVFIGAEKVEDVTEERITAELSKVQAQAPTQWVRRSSRSTDKEELVEQQQREHEEQMRARLRRSESIEKAAEAAALVSQRSMNPREFFRQLSSSSSQSPTSPGSSRTGKPLRRYQRSLTDTAFIFSKAEENTATSPRSSPLVSPFFRSPTSPIFRATSPPTSPDFRPVTSPPPRPRAPMSPPTSPLRPSPPVSALPSIPQTNNPVQAVVEPKPPSPTEPSAPPASPTLLASLSASLIKNNPSQSYPEAPPASPANTPTQPEDLSFCFEPVLAPQAPTAPIPEKPQPNTDLNTATHVHTELVSDIGHKVQAVLVEEDEEEEEAEEHEEDRSLSPSDTDVSSLEMTGCYDLHGKAEEDEVIEDEEQEISENGQEVLAERQMCVRALYDYQAEDESEISFEPGDIIKDVETVDKAWWRGWSKDGRQGLFPANYVETI